MSSNRASHIRRLPRLAGIEWGIDNVLGFDSLKSDGHLKQIPDFRCYHAIRKRRNGFEVFKHEIFIARVMTDPCYMNHSVGPFV